MKSHPQENYTIVQLSDGIEYTANLSLCKVFENTVYRSQPIITEFIADPREFLL